MKYIDPISTRSLARRLFVAAVALVGAATVVACGASPDGSGESAGSESLAVSADSASGCPATAPASGAACTIANLSCSYGSDPRFGCRVESTCTSGAWSTTAPSCAKPPPACPATSPAGEGCTARQDGLTCIYGRTPYVCATDNGDLFIIKNGKPWLHWWALDTLPAGCPTSAVPDLGTACSAAASGVTCNYGGCYNTPSDPDARGVQMSCTDGSWTFAPPICIQ